MALRRRKSFIDFPNKAMPRITIVYFFLRLLTAVYFSCRSALLLFMRNKGLADFFAVNNCWLLNSIFWCCFITLRYFELVFETLFSLPYDVTQSNFREVREYPSAAAGRAASRRTNIARFDRPFAFLIIKHNSAALAWGQDSIERS